MKTFVKSLVIALCCVVCSSPFSVFAEENDVSTFALDGSNYSLNEVQQAKFNELISTITNYSNAAIWYNSTELSLCWTYSISYNSSTSVATFTTRYQMRQDGSIQTQTNSTTNNIYDNSTVHYYLFKYNGVYITGENYVPSTPPVYPTIACPVALNDVLANDYITSLLTWLYRGGVDQFIIYRLQESFDTSSLLNTLTVSQIGEFKGYIVTTPSNVVQTFVYEYNRPTIISPDNGNTWTYQYLNILDPGYASDWEMVLHWTCLDTRYSSEFEAIDNVNSSIQTTIQQNSTIISQNQQIIDSTDKTNDLIENGNSVSESYVDITNDIGSELSDNLSTVSNVESDLSVSINSNLSSLVSGDNDIFSLADFSSSLLFVRSNFTDIWNYSPFGLIVSFCLTIGVMSIIFGRKGD